MELSVAESFQITGKRPRLFFTPRELEFSDVLPRPGEDIVPFIADGLGFPARKHFEFSSDAFTQAAGAESPESSSQDEAEDDPDRQGVLLPPPFPEPPQQRGIVSARVHYGLGRKGDAHRLDEGPKRGRRPVQVDRGKEFRERVGIEELRAGHRGIIDSGPRKMAGPLPGVEPCDAGAPADEAGAMPGADPQPHVGVLPVAKPFVEQAHFPKNRSMDCDRNAVDVIAREKSDDPVYGKGGHPETR